jgi:uncharacterized protein YegL
MTTHTEIVCILDRSGSMNHLTDDTIGGFNAFVEEQKKLDGTAALTLVIFDDRYEVVHDSVPLVLVPELTNETYFCRGGTALLDAVGKAINTVRPKADKADNVAVLIMTDGAENRSCEYTNAQVQALVSELEEKDWIFAFIGAGIDAFDGARFIGKSIDKSAKGSLGVANDSRGSAVAYASANRMVSQSRGGSSYEELDNLDAPLAAHDLDAFTKD